MHALEYSKVAGLLTAVVRFDGIGVAAITYDKGMNRRRPVLHESQCFEENWHALVGRQSPDKQ
jgi:hypothetical protein